MSHSRIFDEYAKIMTANGLLKTAGKKDEDYNVTIPPAGPDTKVEETGWELTEIAHPDQIQVAQSRLNDGIVENGVEQQKIMLDVAFRNPRGVLASIVIKTLIKAANALDSELSDESLKMSAEVDCLIEKLAQEIPDNQFYNDTDELIGLSYEFIKNYKTLDPPDKTHELQQNSIANSLTRYTKQIESAKTKDEKIKAGESLYRYYVSVYTNIVGLVNSSTDMGNDQLDTINASTQFINKFTDWMNYIPKKEAPAPKEQSAPGVASKAPSPAPKPVMPTHNYSVKSEEVKELQGLLSANQDSKFGPRTFEALQNAAKTNSLLDQLMENKPKSYQGWTNSDIGEALNRMKSGQASAVPAVEQDTRKIQTPYTNYEEGYQAGKRGPQKPIQE